MNKENSKLIYNKLFKVETCYNNKKEETSESNKVEIENTNIKLDKDTSKTSTVIK